MFVVVTGRLNYIYADEGELIDNLFTGQRKEDSEYLMKFEHTLEPKKLLQTQYWKTWLKRKKVGPCSTFSKFSANDDEIDMPIRIPMRQPLKFGAILDGKVTKSMRKKDHLERLVKWKKRPPEDST